MIKHKQILTNLLNYHEFILAFYRIRIIEFEYKTKTF